MLIFCKFGMGLLHDLRTHRVKDNQFYIMVPTEQGHALNYISNKYKDYFRVIINEVLHKDYEISFHLKKDNHSRISE